MIAIVTTAFDGKPDNETLSRRIAAGERLEGDLARVAVENGWAAEETAKPAAEGRKKR